MATYNSALQDVDNAIQIQMKIILWLESRCAMGLCTLAFPEHLHELGFAHDATSIFLHGGDVALYHGTVHVTTSTIHFSTMYSHICTEKSLSY